MRTSDLDLAEWSQPEALESPFAEAFALDGKRGDEGFSWSEALSPFADPDREDVVAEADSLLSEALADLRDDAFHEAVAMLAEETEQAVSERFLGESVFSGGQQERFADNYLSSVQLAAEQYLTELESGLAGLDFASLDPERLDETLDSFDPAPGDLTPAGEEFIGSLIKKAKKAVRFVADKAKQVGKLALLGPLLKQLKKLVKPLLKRVLSMAIGRLPAALQPAARKLATSFTGESYEDSEEPEIAPTAAVDTQTLADSFDFRLAEALAYPEALAELESEAFAAGEDEALAESSELEHLAQARGALIDSLNEGDPEALEPAIEQFLPIVLTALRTGIKLVGRPKVVGVIAKYLARLIGRYVDKDSATPLARAIADTGLRLATLEAESDSGEAAPIALASVIEDTVRRFAENEDYVLENEELTQVALGDAFAEAVATHFPAEQVREDLQLAPSLGGTFVTRQPRGLRSYAKYSRAPEIEITSRLADRLPGFGGTTLGAATRAAGGRFPMKARMHVYQMRPGSTVGAVARHDGRHGGARNAYPLTPGAAGVLLREPALGTHVPAKFMRNRHRLAAGQRIYIIEPLGGAAGIARPGTARTAAGRVWLAVNPAKSRITVGFYLSEAEAQEMAGALRAGRGAAPVLAKLFAALKPLARPQGEDEAESFDPPLGEEGESFEDFAAKRGLPRKDKHKLRKRIAAWALTALAGWLRDNAEAFARAAAHPDPGVTLRVRLGDVPGLAKFDAASVLAALRGKPTATITVSPGRRR
ncbi:MAG: hypothetical protein ABI471_02460 [Sphingomonas bacterium]